MSTASVKGLMGKSKLTYNEYLLIFIVYNIYRTIVEKQYSFHSAYIKEGRVTVGIGKATMCKFLFLYIKLVATRRLIVSLAFVTNC